MDYKTLTDEELANEHNAIIAEEERRQSMAIIPDQIVRLATTYVDGGGSIDDLSLEATHE